MQKCSSRFEEKQAVRFRISNICDEINLYWRLRRKFLLVLSRLRHRQNLTGWSRSQVKPKVIILIGSLMNLFSRSIHCRLPDEYVDRTVPGYSETVECGCERKRLGPQKWGEYFFGASESTKEHQLSKSKQRLTYVGIHERECDLFFRNI